MAEHKAVALKNTRVLVLIIALILIVGNLVIDRWPTTLYYGDSNGYYLHVVSLFVNQDVGNYDKTITTLREVNPASADPREDKFGIRLTEKGRRYIKYTLGVPVMEVPFFLLAHGFAKLSPKYEANGWTYPYMLSIGFAIVCYVTLGFYLLIGILKRYFDNKVVWLVSLALVLATNLFYHTNYVTMSHGFLFFQHCLLIYLSAHFFDTPKWWKSLAVGATVGLIALTRVPEVICALVPLLWGVHSWKSFQERVLFFVKNYQYLLGAAIGFFAVFSLQLAYWYYVSGHLVFNPYEGEGFNFLKPVFHHAFFHFKNGWLIYTPIMAFSLLGLFFLRKYTKAPLLSIISFVGLHAWVHYSYYAWTYFPGIGQRPMVETYPLLSFGLAACFAFLWSKKGLAWLPISIVAVFSILNLFQTWQMREGVIWTERHNAAFYWETFGTMKSTYNSLRAYDTKELQPKEENLTLKSILASIDFEDKNAWDSTQLSSTFAKSGQYALYTSNQFFTIIENKPLEDLQAGEWLKLSVDAYMDENDQIYNRDYCLNLHLVFYDAAGTVQKDRHLKVSSHLGNDTYSIWTPGYPNQWGNASFFTKVPKGVQADWTYKVFIGNYAGQKLHLDNLQLERMQ